MARRRPRFRIRAADVSRIEREHKEPRPVRAKRVHLKARTAPIGAISAELREAMRAPASNACAKNGASLGMIMKASPWRKPNVKVMDKE